MKNKQEIYLSGIRIRRPRRRSHLEGPKDLRRTRPHGHGSKRSPDPVAGRNQGTEVQVGIEFDRAQAPCWNWGRRRGRVGGHGQRADDHVLILVSRDVVGEDVGEIVQHEVGVEFAFFFYVNGEYFLHWETFFGENFHRKNFRDAKISGQGGYWLMLAARERVTTRENSSALIFPFLHFEMDK